MSGINVTADWVAPTWDQLNYTTDLCTEASIWAGSMLNQMNALKILQDVPVFVTLDYLRKLLPYGWPEPTNPELGAWYLNWANITNGTPHLAPGIEDAVLTMLKYPIKNCQDELCKNLNWQGDSDVSGVGMMISYYLAAALSTLYFIIIIIGRLGPVQKKTDRSSGLFLFFHSFTDSINTFLDTALIFAAAMLGAAIVRYTSVIRHPDQDTSVYSLVGSVYMSAYTIYPPILLQTVADGLRHQFLRQFLWFVVIVLAIVVEVQYRTANPWQYDLDSVDGQKAYLRHMREMAWNAACDTDERKFQLIKMLTAAHVFLGLNLAWWLYYFVGSFVPQGIRARRDGWKVWGWFTRLRPYLRLAGGLVVLVVMWTMLGIFSKYRAHMTSRSGPDNKDGTWTFGQVLALATWMPVVIDIAAIYIHGPEIGLSMKLSRTWKVVRSSAKVVLEKKNSASPYSKLSLSPADTNAFMGRPSEERGFDDYDAEEHRHTSAMERGHAEGYDARDMSPQHHEHHGNYEAQHMPPVHQRHEGRYDERNLPMAETRHEAEHETKHSREQTSQSVPD